MLTITDQPLDVFEDGWTTASVVLLDGTSIRGRVSYITARSQGAGVDSIAIDGATVNRRGASSPAAGRVVVPFSSILCMFDESSRAGAD